MSADEKSFEKKPGTRNHRVNMKKILTRHEKTKTTSMNPADLLTEEEEQEEHDDDEEEEEHDEEQEEVEGKR